jgi:hypothetical protein
MQYLNKSLLLLFASAALAWAVPSEINYQGRLTDANGDPLTGEVSMSLKMFDAATAGNELYSEDLGTVTLDDNGVYSFQFGASGQSVVDREETIAITDGSSTTFSNTLGSVPLDETLVVADGTYSWNVVDGNPGEQATATAVLANGFVIGVTVTNGGEGYVEPPVVTIEGLGTGATATAVVEDGVITAINVDATGSGYTSATVTIAEPPAPYVVDYDAGAVSVTYETAPAAGTEILATYEANDSSIVGALSAAEAHWLELSVDGEAQSPRERVLSVPFAQVALSESSRLRSELEDIHTLLFSLLSDQDAGLLLISANLAADEKVYVGEKYLPSNNGRVSIWDIPNIDNARALRYENDSGSSYPYDVVITYVDGTEGSGGGGLGTKANPYPKKSIDKLSYRPFFSYGGNFSLYYFPAVQKEAVYPIQIDKPFNYIQINALKNNFESEDLLKVDLLSDTKSIPLRLGGVRNFVPDDFGTPRQVKLTIIPGLISSNKVPNVEQLIIRSSM